MVRKEKGVKIKLDFASKSYRSILIVSYVLVGALALVLMVIGIFSWFKVYIKEQVSKTGMEQLRQMDTVYSSKIDLYYTQLQNAFHEPSIENYIYSDTDDVLRDYEISRYLRNLIVYNETIEYVGFLKNDDFHVHVGTKYPTEQEQGDISLALTESKDDMEHFVVQSDSGERKLCIFITEREKLYGKPERGIIFVINLRKLQKELLADDASGSSVLIFSELGIPLLKNNEFTAEEELEIWEKVREESGKKQEDSILVSGNKYLFSYMESKQPNVSLVLLQDFNVQEEQIAGASRRMYMIFLLVLIAVLLFSIAMASYFYSPVKKFIDSFRDKMDFTETGIESYSKKYTQVTSEKILYQIGMLSAGYYSDKVLSYLNSSEDTDDIPELLKLKEWNKQCLLVLFWQERVDDNQMDALSAEIQNCLEKTMVGCKISMIADKAENTCLVLIKEAIWMNKISDVTWVLTTLKEICEAKTDENPLFCAVSSPIREEDDLQKAYKKIYMLRKTNLLGQSHTVMSETDLNNRDDNIISAKYYQDVLRAAREEESTDGEIEKMLKNIGHYSLNRQFHFLAELAVQISQRSPELSLNPRALQEKYLDSYMKIVALQDQNQLKRFFEQLIANTLLENKVGKEKTLRIQVVDSLDYIQQNYKDPAISVDKVAEMFHISVSYYSKLFNEFVGMTFPEYINDLRLTFAQELLAENSKISIQRVSEVSGFSNLSYFSAQFKKKYGVTPTNFRKIV